MYLNQEAELELDNLANDLTYQAIKFSGLFDLLPANADSDKLAEQWAREVRGLLSRRIDERLGQLEGRG